MTPEAQRIAIAEACGWKRHEETQTGFGGKPVIERGWLMPHGAFVRPQYLPDYLSDLNAMHEAWCALTNEQKQVWVDYLVDICTSHALWTDMYKDEMSVVCNATAAQRAEAFLRTLNLWKD